MANFDAGRGADNTSDIVKSWLQWMKDWSTELGGKWDPQTRTLDLLDIPIVEPLLAYMAVFLFVVPGLVGNCILFFISFRSELRSNSYSVYLCVASVTDSVTLIYLYIHMILQAKGIQLFFIMPNQAICIFVSATSRIVSIMSPWLMVVFSLDRYVAVVFPLKKKLFCTVRNAHLACFTVLVLAIVQQLPAAIMTRFTQFFGNRACIVVHEDAMTLASVEATIGSLVPCLLLIVLNIHSFIAIKRSLKDRMTMSWTSGNSQSQEAADRIAERQSRRLSRSLLTLPIFTFCAAGPHALLTSYIRVSSQTLGQTTNTGTLLMNSEPYLRVIMSTCFGMNLYLLLATSEAYRRISLGFLNRCCCFR